MARVVHDGVLFSDEGLPGEERGTIEVAINLQNATLVEVRTAMAHQAILKGANGVAFFKFYQRGHRNLENFALKWDSESLHGTGMAVRIPRDQMKAAATGDIKA